MWYIKSGYCEDSCKSCSDYIHDTNECRSNVAVNREYLNCIPFFGLRNFHKGYEFEGWCELFNAVMMVISIITVCCYHNNHKGCSTNDTSFVVTCTASATVILHIVKICVMYYTRSADCYEILIIILSAIILCCGAIRNKCQIHGIMHVLTLLVTIITVVLDAIRDNYLDV